MNTTPLNCVHCWCGVATVNNQPHEVCCMCFTRRLKGSFRPGPRRDPGDPVPWKPFPDGPRLQQEQWDRVLRGIDDARRKLMEVPWFSRGYPIAGNFD